MELVKKSSAIAVTASLSTLIDWTSIESLSGFTIIVSNESGGSADDITDVQIDTSVDGGVTVLTDQHADVPTVPIASGVASQADFTETAAFVRVRAMCAAEEDTTAIATLLAASSTGRIATLADVKVRLGIDDTDHDITINRILAGLESIFNATTRRTLIVNAADVTEYYTGTCDRLRLNRYPVVSITSIKEAIDYDFDSAEALTVNTNYRIVNSGENGIIYKPYLPWQAWEDSIQVIYRGGYCPAGQVPGTGEFAMPADLREAAIEQASFIFKRRDDIGLASTGFDGGSINKFSAMKLLPMVEKILKKYERASL